MRKTFWYIVGGQLAAISIPAMAQEKDIDSAHNAQPVAGPDQAFAPDTAEDRQAAMDVWSADRIAAYDGWPAEAQGYFWTLSPERQELFFRLRDTDRLAVVMMDEPGRDEAWRMIEERAAAPAQPTEETDAKTETDNGTPENPEPMGGN